MSSWILKPQIDYKLGGTTFQTDKFTYDNNNRMTSYLMLDFAAGGFLHNITLDQSTSDVDFSTAYTYNSDDGRVFL